MAKAPWESSVGDSGGCVNQQVLWKAIIKQKEKPQTTAHLVLVNVDKIIEMLLNLSMFFFNS